MHNDDLYPRNGRAYVPTVPEAQKEAQDKTLNEVLEELPLIKKTIDRLEKQITHYSSIDSIKTDYTKSPEVHQKEVEANKRVVEVLTKERNYLAARVLNTRDARD